MNAIGPYAKLAAAIVGLAAIVVVVLFAPDQAAAVVTPILGVLTAFGVYRVPNTDPPPSG